MAEHAHQSLMDWLDSSPTPVHVVDTARRRLTTAGFVQQQSFSTEIVSKGFYTLDGSLIAWVRGATSAPLRIVGAHTDSPNLRVQPQPDFSRAGWNQLGIEIYGGVLLNSWLDRDLGLAGRVLTHDDEEILFNVNTPVARVPQLAIHLDREIGEKGLILDRFAHTSPVWGLQTGSFIEWLQSITHASRITSFDAHFYDVTPAAVLGSDSSLLASGRLDNQLSCWAGVTALIEASHACTSILILNDHEEVGSSSVTGAGGALLEDFLAVLAEQDAQSVGQKFDQMRQSWCLSADNAHAVHPNYIDRHDPLHGPLPNLGVAVKMNGNQRYATSPRGLAHIRRVAENSHLSLQTFVSKNNMPCGSTIGPITATRLGIEAIDVGVPQLSMHSARELCAVKDALDLPSLMKAFFEN